MEGYAFAVYSDLLEDLRVVRDTCLEPTAEAARSLERSLFKKFEDDSGSAADDAAYAKFISVNEQCERFKLPTMHEWEWECFGTLKEYLWHFFHPTSAGSLFSTWDEVFDLARAGPGASIRARGEDFYTKHFDSTLTYTHSSRFLVPLYQRAISTTSWWKSAEILRQSIYGFEVVEGSKMSTVPKNRDISRTTCTEPSLNMFIQLGVGEVMTRRLREWGLDIASQARKNSELARVGSINGSFGTIDLSSASDSLSLKMMAAVLPQDVFATLVSLRCDQTELRGKPLELHMISTMGNGYTFALQTVLFTCVVLAVYKCLEIPAVKQLYGDQDTWGVYGDDIIVTERSYNMVVRMLTILGFTVNSEKSFNEGPFRESCGADWYQGVNIRGVYCKSLKTVGARFSLINRLLEWSTRTGINLPRTVKRLLQSVPVVKVPFLESDDAGVKVPACLLGLPDSTGPIAYQKYEKRVEKLRYTKQGQLRGPRKSKLRPRLTNDGGLVVAMLQGSFNRGTIALRANPLNANYLRCRGSVNYWDALTRVTIAEPGNRSGLLSFVTAITPSEWLCWSSTVVQHLR